MSRRLSIAHNNVVKDVVDLKIAQGGVVKAVTRALVSMGGQAVEFYPAVGDGSDERIKWDNNSIFVRQKSVETDGSHATIWFVRSQGIYYYKDYPNADLFRRYLAPPLDGTAGDNTKYLIRAAIQSGTSLSGSPTEVWLDLNGDGQYLWELVQSGAIVGFQQSQYIISIAADDGAGNPVVSTQVDKTVNFETEVLAASNIGWSELERTLVEIKEGADADCSITFSPLGECIGDADTSGAFNDLWLAAGGDPTGMTVRVDVVSGQPPTGSSLAIDLPLDTTRQWVLTAGEVVVLGEDFNNELDVTVTDGGSSVTKRINMHSHRTAPPAAPVWTTTQWFLTDVGFPLPFVLETDYFIKFALDGNATGRMTKGMIDQTQETEQWLPAGESASDYEVRLQLASGFDGLRPPLVKDVWYRLTEEREFWIVYGSGTQIRTNQYLATVRKIGQVGVGKIIDITKDVEAGGVNP